jgi:hypothetical protein
MRSLVVSGYGTTLRVSGRALELANKAENRRESFSAHQLLFDSVVVEGNSGNLTFEAAWFLAVHGIPVTFLRCDGTVLDPPSARSCRRRAEARRSGRPQRLGAANRSRSGDSQG